jgi:TPR repeat protein
MTDIPALPAGFRLGHYEIRRALDANGVVLIYRARDVRTQEKTWIEELLPMGLARRNADSVTVEPDGTKNERAFETLREAFLRQGEKRIVLTNPSLAKVRELIEGNGTAYLVVEAAEGMPLEDRFEEMDRSWTWEETGALGLPLVESIAELHAHDLLHLDIHPGNILLRHDAPPLLLGAAGAAALRGHAPVSGYGAVELYARESKPGPAADLYALGALLYRCLNGAPPAAAPARLAALSRGEPDPLQALASYGEGRPGPYVVDTLLAMLRVLPHERLASAPMVRDRLKSRRRPLAGPGAGQSPAGPAKETSARPEKTGAAASAPKRSVSAASQLRWLWAPALLIGGVYAYQAWQLGQRDDPAPATESPTREAPPPLVSSGKKAPGEGEAFARLEDEERIRRYREQLQSEKAAAERVEAGRRHLVEGRFTEPDEQNAVSEFRAALALDPKNPDARKGLHEVATRLVHQAEEALRAQRWDEAQNLLDHAAGISPDHKRLGELRGMLTAQRLKRAEETRIAEQLQLLERERARQIEEWLARAETAFRQDQLATPVGTSALDYFRQVLSLVPEHEAAKEGMRRIASRYGELSREALARDKLDEAETLANSAAAVRPDEPSLPALRGQIQARKQALALAADRERQRREQEEMQRVREQEKVKQTQEKRNQEVELKAGLDAYYAASYAEAFALLRPLAEQGVARAQFRLAVMYQRGRGVAENAGLALEWARKALPSLRRAAEGGEAWAQSDLGTLYEQGFALEKDEAEAVRWYRRAATQGYAGAQTNLGVMYAQGRGVERSREQAVEWLNKAAAQGDRIARENLRAMSGEAP